MKIDFREIDTKSSKGDRIILPFDDNGDLYFNGQQILRNGSPFLDSDYEVTNYDRNTGQVIYTNIKAFEPIRIIKKSFFKKLLHRFLKFIAF